MEAWRERVRLFLRSRKKEQLLTALLVAAILLLAFWPTKSREDTDGEETVQSVPLETEQAADINNERKNLENQLKEMLQQVEGVGMVDVAITLESTGSKTVEKDTPDSSSSSQKSGGGESEKSENRSTQEETVYLESADGSKTPYVIKETMPKVRGVLVIAQGADDPRIVAEIKEAAMALFHLEAHKIKVMKMK